MAGAEDFAPAMADAGWAGMADDDAADLIDAPDLSPDDPVVIRLEQLAAQLPVPAMTIARLETVLVAQFTQTMAAAARPTLRTRLRMPSLRRAVAVGLAMALLFA